MTPDMTTDWNAIKTATLPANCGWRGDYRVRYSEITANGKATLPALADYMQDAAGWGAKRIGLAYDDTVDQGVAWVLARMVINVRDYPDNGDIITVETWPSGITRRAATRDFRLCDATGRIIAVAQSFWALFDLDTRRAARWPDWLMARLPDPPGPKLIDPALHPALAPGPLPDCDTLKARPSDLDIYGHVNNVRLMQWILGVAGTNSTPDFQPAMMDIRFRTEIRVQERVTVRHANGFAAIVRTSDDTELVRAHIIAPDTQQG
ncbi:acyl-[acyl-carrier-protein] thioesterase [Thalassospira sp.]|uniref:acyl-[acyl-carrier-protein] thioesterase n=1 Tax=Thalassospira sp. TaxID=1912094 RepID=UPI002732C8AC|nr:acyl-ACP thioesterase domain-containing protein [Thalassospira sp.]MDP2697323.1 thioesterase [Thalassospira sp.]